MLEVAVAHGQHTTRRAFFKGAAATILAGTVAGTVVAAPTVTATEAFPTPDMMRVAADGMITSYRRYGIEFIPQPNGSIGRCIYAGEDTPYEHDAVSRLDQRMKDWPELRQAVMDRVRERHRA
jgi:hypothetical protein